MSHYVGPDLPYVELEVVDGLCNLGLLGTICGFAVVMMMRLMWMMMTPWFDVAPCTLFKPIYITVHAECHSHSITNATPERAGQVETNPKQQDTGTWNYTSSYKTSNLLPWGQLTRPSYLVMEVGVPLGGKYQSSRSDELSLSNQPLGCSAELQITLHQTVEG